MSEKKKLHPFMIIPPPLMFVLTFIAGVGLQHVMPISILQTRAAFIGHFVGEGMAIAGMLLALSCLTMFLWARTTIIPFASAASLVTHGPYRFTRNPMYVSLVLVYVGVAGLLTQLWPLLLLPAPVAIIHRVVIPFEEGKMHEIFGESFAQYCQSVRRWI